MTILELYSSPDKWTQGTYARSKTGERRNVMDSDASCFCLDGALQLCYHTVRKEWAEAVSKLEMAIQQHFSHRLTGKGNILADFNDNPTTTFKDVFAVVTEAKV